MSGYAHVRNGSATDLDAPENEVRCALVNGHRQAERSGPKSAMTEHPRPVGSSEKCHKRKSSPNLIAKCSERDAQSANETFRGRSSVSIADLPLQITARWKCVADRRKTVYASRRSVEM
jgi:hypothetical protein